MEHNTSNFGLDLRATFSETYVYVQENIELKWVGLMQPLLLMDILLILEKKDHSPVLPLQTSCDPDPLLTAWLNACQQYISTIPPRILMNIPAPVRSRAGNTCNQSANNRR